MYVRMKKPIGEIAVVMDAAKRLTEFVDVDAISIEAHGISNHKGLATFGLVLGGIDSRGAFHMDPAHQDNIANIVIDRNQKTNPDQRRAFDASFRDVKGNTLHHWPADFYAQLYRSLIPIAYKMIWGGQFPDMEVFLDDEPIFQPDHLKPLPVEPEAAPSAEVEG